MSTPAVTNFEFKDIEQVQKFNQKYSQKGSEKTDSFQKDFKEALSIINSNIPSSEHNFSANNIQSKEFEHFSQIANRSFSELHLPEREATELTQLMCDTQSKLYGSKFTNQREISGELAKSIQRLVQNEIIEENIPNVSKLNGIDIDAKINDEQKTLTEQIKIKEKGLSLPSKIGIGSLGTVGFISTTGGLLTMFAGPIVIPFILIGIVMLAIAFLFVHLDVNSQDKLSRDIDEIYQRIRNLNVLKQMVQEPGFEKFINDKVIIKSLDGSELQSIMNYKEEWTDIKKLVQNPEFMKQVSNKPSS